MEVSNIDMAEICPTSGKTDTPEVNVAMPELDEREVSQPVEGLPEVVSLEQEAPFEGALEEVVLGEGNGNSEHLEPLSIVPITTVPSEPVAHTSRQKKIEKVGKDKTKRKLNFSLVNKPTLTIKDVNCPICYSILWEPITPPCGHSLCKPCFNKHTDLASLNCAVCRKRMSLWHRQATRNNSLLDEKLWQRLKEQFASELSSRENGDFICHADEATLDKPRDAVQCEKPGEIYEDLRKILQPHQEDIEKKRLEEECISSGLIQKITKEEEERLAAIKEREEQDYLLAKQLEQELNKPKRNLGHPVTQRKSVRPPKPNQPFDPSDCSTEPKVKKPKRKRNDFERIGQWRPPASSVHHLIPESDQDRILNRHEPSPLSMPNPNSQHLQSCNGAIGARGSPVESPSPLLLTPSVMTAETTGSTLCDNAFYSSNEEATGEKHILAYEKGFKDIVVDDDKDPIYLARVEKYKFQAMKDFRRFLGEVYDETDFDEVIPPTDSEEEEEGEMEIDLEKVYLEAELFEAKKLKRLQEEEDAKYARRIQKMMKSERVESRAKNSDNEYGLRSWRQRNQKTKPDRSAEDN